MRSRTLHKIVSRRSTYALISLCLFFFDFLALLLLLFSLLIGRVFACFSKNSGGYPARKAWRIAKGKKARKSKKQGKGHQGLSVLKTLRFWRHRNGAILFRAPKDCCDFICNLLAAWRCFSDFCGKTWDFTTLRFETAVIFLRLRIFGTLRSVHTYIYL